MLSKKTLVMLIVLVLLGGLLMITEGPWQPGREEDDKAPVLFDTGGGEDVTRIEINRGPETIYLNRSGGGWLVGEGDGGHPADPALIDRVLDQLDGLNEGTVVSRNPDAHSSFMVGDQDALRIVVFTGDNKAADFVVGGQGPDFFSNYVRKTGSDEVILVKGYVKPLLDKPAKKWRDLTLISFEAQRAVEIRTGPAGKDMTLKKENGNWRIVLPEERDVDPAVVEDLVARISSLKASDIHDEDTGVEGGFENPALELTVLLEDGTSQELAVGNIIEGENKYYASAEGKETIYILSAHTVSDLEEMISLIASEG